MHKKSAPFFIGLMLLSFFFGAGNLIFPPFLGRDAGSAFWPATTGFVITAIALPLMTLIAIMRAKTSHQDGMRSLASRVHPWFGLLFSIAIYLSIGAMYGIPRAANVGYEIGFKPLIGNWNDAVGLTVYVVLFFTICYVAARHTSHLVDWIGRILTPLLVLSVIILCFSAFRQLHLGSGVPAVAYADNPLARGILEGYSTMDALAALAFGSVVIRSIGEDRPYKTLHRQMITASLVAGIGLGLIYFGLAWIGGTYSGSEQTFANGAELLRTAAVSLLGPSGSVLFGILVILACMTTCIGLINACAHFAHELYSGIRYGSYVLFFTIAGALFSNLGLKELLSVAVPMLVFLYPLTIVLVLLGLMDKFFASRVWVYRLGMAVTLIFALSDTLQHLGRLPESLIWLLQNMPLGEIGFAWVVPFLIAAAIGALIPCRYQSA